VVVVVFPVFLLLAVDVVLHFVSGYPAHSLSKVSLAPELVTPQLTFDAVEEVLAEIMGACALEMLRQ